MLSQNHLKALGKTVALVTLAIAMLIYPQDVLAAASQGLSLWAGYVLPALLPFFILSELLMGTGFVHLIGVLLEPVMRPVFRLPGSGAFVVAMGFTSGPPIGAILTAKLYREKLLTQIEAERLLTFTNNPSPGFMLGAVAAGMFGNPGLGIVLAFANYLANLLLGIGLRFYGGRGSVVSNSSAGSTNLWRRSLQAMFTAQRKDGRPLGQLIGDSIRSSVNTILIVGGFILFFAVLIRLLSILGVIRLLTVGLSFILAPLGLSTSLYPAAASGLLEMTLGTKAAAAAAAPVTQQVLMAAAIMAWSGISVHAQVASFISGTAIRLTPFVLGRLVHAVLTAIIASMALRFSSSVPVLQSLGDGFTLWQSELLALLLAFVTTALCAGILLLGVNRLTIRWFRPFNKH